MKTASRLLLLTVLAGSGCWTLPTLFQQPNMPPPAVEPPKPRGPVQPEQVNEDNARQKAAALAEELDRDRQSLEESGTE